MKSCFFMHIFFLLFIYGWTEEQLCCLSLGSNFYAVDYLLEFGFKLLLFFFLSFFWSIFCWEVKTWRECEYICKDPLWLQFYYLYAMKSMSHSRKSRCDVSSNTTDISTSNLYKWFRLAVPNWVGGL
jgi:hypothetical protein